MAQLLVLCFFLVASFATTLQHVESRHRYTLPSGWVDIGAADSTEEIGLTFVLAVPRADALHNHALRVSDPKSPLYTHYLTLEEVAALYAPPEETVNGLVDWLKKCGCNNVVVTPSRDFISLTLSVEMANAMFNINLRQFEHGTFGKVIRTLEPYSLPSNIAPAVSFVGGLVRFPGNGQIQSSQPVTVKRQSGGVNPPFIWNAFKTGGISGTNSGNSHAVAQFLGQFYDPHDLSGFLQYFKIAEPKVTEHGPNTPTNPGIEASLDIEYIIGTAPGIPTSFYSTSGEHKGQERFVVWATSLNSDSNIPLVHSVSYGDTESSITFTYATRLEVEFQKLALRGVTVLFASGDNGVGCTNNCVNQPNWPASSPFVTAVGGFVQGFDGDGISSGGFSNYFGRPSWQNAAVAKYFTTSGLPPASQYNKTGRGVPDVSAFSENVPVLCGGEWMGVGGTSCAAPTFAGIVSLINDALLNANKKPLGSINPALYQIGASTPDAFIDITSGNNGNGCCDGFNCQPGWDPLSGWGGPNFPVLSKAFASLQD